MLLSLLLSLLLFQPPAGEAPEVFLPGKVSNHLSQRDAALSPDGRLFMYTISSYSHPVIMFTQFWEGSWSEPQVASFSGIYSDLEPHFSADGNTLYFASNRPLQKGDPPKDHDIWYVTRQQDGWSEPVNMGHPINTPANEFYPSVTRDGTLYWCAVREDGIGREDIFRSRLQDGRYQVVEVLPDSINTPADEYNAYVARDESYIIFTSTGWGRGEGSGDLWISFRKPDSSWTRARNMGPLVNSPAFEFCPFVTEDGKWLLFTSNRTNISSLPSPATYQHILEYASSPINKLHSIYIMDAAIIEKLRNETNP